MRGITADYSRYPTPTDSSPRVVWFLELLASAKTVGYVCKLLAVERNVDASTHTSISCTIECSPPLSLELSDGVLVVQGRGDLKVDSKIPGELGRRLHRKCRPYSPYLDR